MQEKIQYHLIFENKTTYQALLPQLTETNFSTLIYGAGSKIVKSIEQFDWQFSTKGSVQHMFFNFIDIDRAGITIWQSLTKRRQVLLAIPFMKHASYRAIFIADAKVMARLFEYLAKNFVLVLSLS